MDERIGNVEQSVVRLEVEMAHLQVGVAKILDNQDRNHRCLRKALYGSLEHPGLIVRTDRLEGWRKRQGKFIAVLFTVTLPLAIARAWGLFTGGS
jgi:hypothetical protein